jgi:NADPH:quinone reductase-like Zn-dependent oxidoreductase
VALTAWTNLVAEAGLRAGETVLVTGAASGVGTFAVQLARQLGARVLAAGRSPERLQRLRELGAEILLPLAPDLGERLLAATTGRGVDVVLDLVGGPHLGAALPGVAVGGRWVVVGLLAGRQATVDLSLLLRRRIRLVGSVLRSRSRAEKAELVSGFVRFAADRLADGRLRPVIDAILPLDAAAEAYRRLEESRAFGKIVLVTR